MSDPARIEAQKTSSISEKGSPTEQIISDNETGNGFDDGPKPHIHARTYLAVFAVNVIYFAQVYCLVGGGAQQQAISAQFDGTSRASWLTGVMAIFTVVLGPPCAQASDYWGRKWFLVSLSLSGAVGCVIVARANSMNMLIGGFCVIGTAFGMQPLLHTVASEVLPRRLRGWAQALVMGSNAMGLCCGLLIGGALNRDGDPDGFRYYFYIGMVLFAGSAVITLFSYRPLPSSLQKLSFSEKMRKLDWVGFGLLASGLVLFCLGLSYSQNPYPWSDPHVSAPFAIGLALAISLAIYEYKFKTDGMFHHGLFQSNRNFAVSLFCIFAEGVAFFGANVYFAFQVNVLYETDTLLVGLNFAIAFLAGLPACAIAGLYCTKTKSVRWVTFLAFVIFTAFFACMATTDTHSRNAVWGYPILMGTGLGITLIVLLTAAQLSIPPQLISVASGIMISVRSLGGTIGIAIYNAVFTSQTNHIPSNVASAALKAGLPATSVEQFVGYLAAQNETALAVVPGVTPEIIGAGADALLNTYAVAFRYVWITAIPFTVLATIASVFLFDPSQEFTNHIDAPVEEESALYSE